MITFFYKNIGIFMTGYLILIISSKAIEIKETEVNDCTHVLKYLQPLQMLKEAVLTPKKKTIQKKFYFTLLNVKPKT